MRPNNLGEVVPFLNQLTGTRQLPNMPPPPSPTAPDGDSLPSASDIRHGTHIPSAAQRLLPPDARSSRESSLAPSLAPSLALTEETIMEELPSYAGHIHRAEHNIRMRRIRERL